MLQFTMLTIFGYDSAEFGIKGISCVHVVSLKSMASLFKSLVLYIRGRKGNSSVKKTE